MTTGSLIADVLIAVVGTVFSVLAARYGWKVVIKPDDKSDVKVDDKKPNQDEKKVG